MITGAVIILVVLIVFFAFLTPIHTHHLVGQVVKASTSGAEDSGCESRLRKDFFRVELYQ